MPGTDVPTFNVAHHIEHPKTFQGQMIPIFGHQQGRLVPSSSHRLGTLAPNNQATYTFAKGAIVEVEVYDSGDPIDGTAENVLIAPGISTTTIASLDPAATAALLKPTFRLSTFQHKLNPDQDSLAIGTLSTGAKTLLFFARVLE
jgi:hypothetical protein